MSSWELNGTPGYLAGSSGTATVPPGASVLQVIATATAGGATLSIFGGASIPVPAGAPLILDFHHRLFQAIGTGASAQIATSGTASYFIHYVKSGNT